MRILRQRSSRGRLLLPICRRTSPRWIRPWMCCKLRKWTARSPRIDSDPSAGSFFLACIPPCFPLQTVFSERISTAWPRGGGSDHPVSIDGLIDSGPDLDLKSSDCHAPKAALLGAFSAILAGVSAKDLFPRQVAFALVHFGDTWLSFVPAELTVHAGAAVNTAVLNIVQNARDLHRDSQATAIVAGLANSYIQYVATGAEYAFQAYEGASTLYGPRSAEFFAQVIEELALDLVGVSQPDSRRMGQSINADYMFAPRQDRLPIRSEPPREARFRPLSLCTIAEMMPPALCFRWTHAEPGQVPLTTAPWVELISAEGQSAAALPDGVRCD